MMLFKPEHVPLILEGKKTMTRRRWKTRRAKIGTIHQARTKLYGKPFAYLAIIDAHQERLGEMPFGDAIKEGYPSMRGFMDKWIEINRGWNPDDVVWVVTFALVSSGEKK